MIRLNREDYGGIHIRLKIERITGLILSLGLQKDCLWMSPSLVRGDVKNIVGNRKNSSKDPDRAIYYAGIWQELCLAESEECTKWARSLIVDAVE